MEKDKRTSKIIGITLLGSVANLGLLAFKFVAGIVGHSSAMIADAVHSLSDFLTDIVVLVFVKLSSRPKDNDHAYGHGKYETLATAVIGIALMAVGIGLFWNGAEKIYGFYFRHQELADPGMIALVAALVSIAVKEVLYRVTVAEGRRQQSQALVANAWHHRSDAFSSVATAVGIGGAMALGPDWRVLDSMAAVAVSVLIVKAAWDLIVPAVNELMEKSLPEDVETEIVSIISSVPGVDNPHNLCTRRIGNCMAADVHIRVDGAMKVCDAHQLTRDIERRLRERFGASMHISIHVEPRKNVDCGAEQTVVHA